MASKKVLKEQTIERIRIFKNEYSTVKEFKQSDEYQSLVNGFMNGYEREHADTIITMVYDGKSFDTIRKTIQKMNKSDIDIAESDENVKDKKSETPESFFMVSQGKVVEVDPVYVIIGDEDESDEKSNPEIITDSCNEQKITQCENVQNENNDNIKSAETPESFFMVSQGKVVETSTPGLINTDNDSKSSNENEIVSLDDAPILPLYYRPELITNVKSFKGIIRSVLTETFNMSNDCISDIDILSIGSDIAVDCYDQIDINGSFTDEMLHTVKTVIGKWVDEHKDDVKKIIAA